MFTITYHQPLSWVMKTVKIHPYLFVYNTFQYYYPKFTRPSDYFLSSLFKILFHSHACHIRHSFCHRSLHNPNIWQAVQITKLLNTFPSLLPFPVFSSNNNPIPLFSTICKYSSALIYFMNDTDLSVILKYLNIFFPSVEHEASLPYLNRNPLLSYSVNPPDPLNHTGT